ncbi:MAG: hypothetical protein U0234_27910 [Sandaracinus sp.]
MKTAVSIPDPIFLRADAQAKRLGVSRSELYARALDAYARADDDSWVTRAYDEAYADGTRSSRYGDPDDDTTAFVRAASRRSARLLAKNEKKR